MSPRSPFALDYTCHVCGKHTAVNMRSGLMHVRNRPGTREHCPESGAAVVDPDYSLTTPARRQNNPYAVPYRCTGCGVDTKANRRTGFLYSHPLPGSTEVCPESGRGVIDPEGGIEFPPMPIQSRGEPEPANQPRVAPGPSQSVRTVSGGLPSHGRRY
jgi:hypothetical protein